MFNIKYSPKQSLKISLNFVWWVQDLLVCDYFDIDCLEPELVAQLVQLAYNPHEQKLYDWQCKFLYCVTDPTFVGEVEIKFAELQYPTKSVNS